jgi:hypothetical protein
MKLAIIGSGPLALYASKYFYDLGAQVVLFYKSALGGNIRFCNHFNIEGFVDYPSKKSYEEFYTQDLLPLINLIEKENIGKLGDVLRVHKRFLHAKEEVFDRSRLVDMFRVVYSVNPKETILKQVEENKEIFSSLGEHVIASLHEAIESYEDFDLVIEATGLGKEDFHMGPSGTMAINELNLKKHSHFFYGKDFFKNFELINNAQSLVIVGDDVAAYIAVAKLSDWLFNNHDRKIYWVKNKKLDETVFNISYVLDRDQLDFDEKVKKYEEDLFRYRSLMDYEKVKFTTPVEPQKKLHIYEGYNITSVDKLLDQNGIFVTIESPIFRSFVKKANDLKTIACDYVIVQNGQKENESLKVNMTNEEPGFYSIHTSSIRDGIEEIFKIEQDIMKYFKKSSE